MLSKGIGRISESIGQVKSRLVDQIFLYTAIILFPGVAVTTARISITGFLPLYIFQWLLLGSLLVTYILRRRLTVNMKSLIFSFTMVMGAVLGMSTFGYFGEAKIFLILVPLFIAILFGARYAYYSIIFMVLLLASMGYFIVNGYTNFNLDANSYLERPITWFTLCLATGFVMVIMIHVVSTLLNAQEKAFQNEIESSAQVSSMANSLPGVIFQFRVPPDRNYYFSYISDKATEIFGLSSDPSSQDWRGFDRIHDEDKPKLLTMIDQSIEKRSDFIFEGRLLRDGKIKWFKALSSPVEIKDDLVFNGVLLDVTAEKDAQQQVMNEQQFNELLINNLPGIFFSFRKTNGDYSLAKWNKNLELELDVPSAELQGISIKELTFDMKSESTYKAFRSIENRGMVDSEIILKNKSGSGIPFLISAQVIERGDGSYLFGVGINITELKAVQQELSKHQEHLSLLVKEKTDNLEDTNQQLMLTNEELQGALKKLKETQNMLIQSEKMASIGTFVAGIAHEINNPLNFIAGGQTILGHSLEDFSQFKGTEAYDDMTTAHEMITNGMGRVTGIVKALMTFSYSGQSVLKEADLNKIVDDSLLFLKSKIKDRVEVIKEYQLNQKVPVYEEKVHQILMNLLDNGIFASTRNSKAVEPRIEIYSGIVEQNSKKYAMINIFNTGDSIPTETIKQIFDPFFTTKEPGEGTGLGLSISYSLMQEHKGEIKVENTDEGVRFSLLFPSNSV